MNYYHGEISTPVERHIDIYIAETDHQHAEWKVWDEAKAYGARFIRVMNINCDEREFIDECEGRIIDQITDEEYHAAIRRGERCMNYPRQECGECPYWLAFGEPETTDEQNEAILAHCARCNACDGKCFECDLFNSDIGECGKKDYNEAQEYLDKMMRAARQQIVFRKAIHGEGNR